MDKKSAGLGIIISTLACLFHQSPGIRERSSITSVHLLLFFGGGVLAKMLMLLTLWRWMGGLSQNSDMLTL